MEVWTIGAVGEVVICGIVTDPKGDMRVFGVPGTATQ